MNILIVGAGPAGSALAGILDGGGVQVTLVEQTHYQTPRVGELLSPQGKAPLLRVLPRVMDHVLSPLRISGCWSSPSLETSFHSDWWALDRLGLDRALAFRAQELGAELFLDSRVRDLKRHDRTWSYQLETTDGVQTRSSDWVVDATGRASKVARSLGAYRQRLNLQSALVGVLECDESAQPLPKTMHLEAVEHGWWYAAPLHPGTAVATYVTDTDLDRGKPDQAWQRALEATIYLKKRLTDYRLKELPRRVAAGASHLMPGYGSGWVAVGDAAAAFDPLSNFGLGHAVSDGIRLGELFLEALNLGTLPRLDDFAEERGGFYSDAVEELGLSYRQVRRWPDSTFWARRSLGSQAEESQMRIKVKSTSATRTLIFAPDQRFTCNRCGKCCRSHWTPEVDAQRRARISSSYQALKVLQEKSLPPLTNRSDGRVVVTKDQQGACVFLQSDNDCSLHGHEDHLKPSACSQFPFVLRDTPSGTVVGVSFLCDAVARNEGAPLQDHAEEIHTLLASRAPTTLSPKVPVTWGRSVDWPSYERMEQHLLESDDVAAAARDVRWGLACWVHSEQDHWQDQHLIQNSPPLALLLGLDQLLSLALIGNLEGVEQEVDLFESLLNDRLVHLKRSGWQGNLRSLPEMVSPDVAPWLRPEMERYLRALVQRKFLLVQMPLLSNLCLLSALPQVLVYYTSLYSLRSGNAPVQKEDYYQALALVETDLVTYGRLDHTVRVTVKAHLETAARAARAQGS